MTNAGVAHTHDVAHQAANVLKHRRQRDERWSEFVSKLAQTGAKVRQTGVRTRRAVVTAPGATAAQFTGGAQ